MIKELKPDNHFANIYLGKNRDNDSLKSRIHPIAIFNAELIEKAIGELNRIVIIMPNKYYSAYWASVLSVFSRIKNKYNDESNIGKYGLGQKIIINDMAIASFYSLKDDGELIIETSDARINVKNNFLGSIKPIKTKRGLSATHRVLSALKKESARTNPVDKILSINSLGDTSFYKDKTYLISKAVTSRQFFDTRYLNGELLDKILNIGSITHNSQVKPFGSGQVSMFNFLISSDFLNFFEYYESIPNHRSEDNLIIDGISHIKRHIGNFIFMLERNWLPVSIVTDYSELEDLEIIKDFNFSYWHWTGNLLEKIQQSPINHPYFKSFSESVEKNKHIELKDIPCNSDLLTDIVKNLNKIERKMPEDNIFLKSEFSKLFGLVVSFAKMIALPEEPKILDIRERLNDVQNNIDSQSIFIKQDVLELIHICIECLRDVIAAPEKYLMDKINNINNQLNGKDSKEYYLLVQRSQDIEVTKQFWDGALDEDQKHKVHVISLVDLLNENDYKTYIGSEKSLFVCGWLNRSNMQKVIFQQVAFSTIYFFFYEFEKEWYGFAARYWDQKMKEYKTSSNLAEMYDISLLDRKNDLFKQSLDDPSIEKKYDIFDFEKKMKNYTNAKYVGSEDSEPVKTKKMVFASDYFMFSTETHRFFVINEDQFDKTDQLIVEDKTRDGIFPGHRVVLSFTEADLLKEKADELLARDGKDNFRSLAYLWKHALIEEYVRLGNNTTKLKVELAASGCDVNIATLRNWLFDKTNIGPQDESNIDRIAKLTSNDKLMKKLKRVKTAIKTVRSYHQKAAFAIKRDLIENLSFIFHESDHEEMHSNDLIEVNLSDYGNVFIIKLLDIGQDAVEVDPKYANRLMHGEN